MFTFFFYFNNFIFLEDRLRYDWRIFSFDMSFQFSSLEQKLQRYSLNLVIFWWNSLSLAESPKWATLQEYSPVNKYGPVGFFMDWIEH